MKKKIEVLKATEILKPFEPLKLDISYGPFIPEGFKRFDFFKCNTAQWPYKDGSVEEIYSAYVLCRIPGRNRGQFMDEAYRVLKPEGKMVVIVPYAFSSRGIQDYTFEWPPICEQSFLYFNKEWRKQAQVDYPINCDFDFSYGHSFDPDTANRSDDARPFWIKHYLNSVNDIQINMVKK